MTVKRGHRSFGIDAASQLAYGRDGSTRYAGVTGSPALEHLKTVAGLLCRRFEWSEAEAVAFVLTTGIPLGVWPLQVQTHLHWETDELQWVELKVRPGVPPQAVEEAYREVLKRASRGTRRRASTIKDRHLQLVKFVDRQGGVVTSDLVRQWNRAHPRWRYSKPGNCRRDYGKLKARLTQGVPPAEADGAKRP